MLCNDNGTPNDSSDDIFTFDLEVTGSNTGLSWIANDTNSTGGNYGLITQLGAFAISKGDLDLRIVDVDDANCFVDMEIQAPSPCSSDCPTINIQEDYSICISESTFDLNDLIIESPEGTWSFTSGQENLTIESSIVQIENLPKGIYEFTYQLNEIPGDECPMAVTIPIELLEVEANTILGETKLCPDEGTVLSSENQYTSYQWSTGATTQSIDVLETGSYRLTYTDNQSCIGIQNVEVSNWKALIANDDIYNFQNTEENLIDILKNDEIEDLSSINTIIVSSPKNGNVEIKNEQYIYTPNNLQKNFDDEFVYEICNQSCDDCVQARVTIHYRAKDKKELEMLLTPNGDGENDILGFSEISNNLANEYPNNNLVVYTRWGDIVFEKDAYNNDWNGDYKGKPLPDGTYYFTLRLDTGNANILKGYILIIR